MAFYDRKRELALLDNLYSRPQGQMFVLYGRRRVGKTALLTHWLETRRCPALFWTADRTSAGSLLRSFSQAILGSLHPEQTAPLDFTYSTWEVAFNELTRLAQSHRIVIVLDEFTYLIEAEPALISILQRVWDHRLKKSNLLLVLTGSHAGMIEREILAYRSPLYHRASSHLHLQPLSFGVLAEFFPSYSTVDRASIYACVGGVPQYLELLDPKRTAETNIRNLLSSSMIIDDAGALLRDQLGEPRNYAAVVESIAAGYSRSTEIAKMANLQDSSVSKYLSVLQNLDIVAREVPTSESRPERSKLGRYRLVDHYLRFYYRFLAPNRTNLQRGLTEQVWQNIRQHLPEFVGTHIFEEICREWVLRQGDAGRLPFVPRRVGSDWGKGKPQIDVMAVNEDDHAILLGERKWLNEPIRRNVVTEFFARATRSIPAPPERWKVTYAFFSRSGFTDEARRAAADYQCLWISLADIDATLRQV
ncbi:MAG TPA: ATP-binding protein [Pyrinomonadaceae bacterium]|nr:ATP-binding protein [Pyrinomonadaceae bacterium]HLE62732.1 ATP-binding protein [Pyrinomonadaceae bacterium]